MRTIDQITEDALSGWGPFPMTNEEIVRVMMHDPYARHMSELPTYCCGRPIQMVPVYTCDRCNATIHVTFTSCTEVWRRVNGVDVPEPPDRGYDPKAFVLLRGDDDTSNQDRL